MTNLKNTLLSLILISLSNVAAAEVVYTSPANAFSDMANDDAFTISLGSLSEHDNISLSFDLFAMDSLDGVSMNQEAPDTFGFKIDGVEYDWIFRARGGSETNPDRTWDTGDYNDVVTWGSIDRYFENYNDGFTIEHSGETLEVEFFVRNLQAVYDESFRVENINITSSFSGSALNNVSAPIMFSSVGFLLLGFGRIRAGKKVI